MNENKITLLAVVCAAFTALLTATSCATSENRPVDTVSERSPSKKLKKKKREKAGEYQLHGSKKELDAKILKRGERAQYAPALDSY